jgi:hypothetical protein
MVFFVFFACVIVTVIGVILADQLSQEARRREEALRVVDEMIEREKLANKEYQIWEQEQKDRYLY